MNQSIGVLLFMLFGMTAYSQTIVIQDEASKEPLVGVNLSSDGAEILIMTDQDGQADISPFVSTATSITASYLGYETETRTIERLRTDGWLWKLTTKDVLLDQIVVSATKWNDQRRNVPVRIASIDQDEVLLNNPQTAADLLDISGEVFIQKSQQGGGSPMIRGFSTNRLLYSVDGVRMNTAIFRSGNLQNVISIDPYSVEKTEVVFGPGSVIYGSDAIGGVMSFTTLAPELSQVRGMSTTGSVSVRHSTANQEFTGHFDINMGWEKWALLTSITSNRFGDLRMGSNGPEDYLRPFYVERRDSQDVIVSNDDPLVQTPTAYDQINLMQKVLFKPNEKWSFDLNLMYSATTDFPRYDRYVRLRDGKPRSAEWNYGPQTWSMNAINARYKESTLISEEINFKIAYQRFEESRMDRDFNQEIRNLTEETVHAYSLNLDFYKNLSDHWRLYYGLESVLNDVESSGSEENITSGEVSAGPSRYPEAQWWSHAAYVTAQFDINETLGFTSGLRYNTFQLNADFTNNLPYYPFEESMSEVQNSALSGSVGMLCRPGQSTVISLNGSVGFRAPNVDDIGKVFDSEPGAVVVPNPDLSAEQAYNLELGFAHRWNDVLKIDASLYYTYLDNAMVRRDFTLNGQDSIVYEGELSKVQAIQNAAYATVYGAQVGLEVKFAQKWSWSSRINYQKGEEELDDGSTSPSRHAAPLFGHSKIQFRNDRISMDFGVVFNGERSFDDMPIGEIGKPFLYALNDEGNPYSPAWYSINYNIRYSLSETFEVSGGIENITDQRYRTYSSGIAAPGRNFIIGLKANF